MERLAQSVFSCSMALLTLAAGWRFFSQTRSPRRATILAVFSFAALGTALESTGFRDDDREVFLTTGPEFVVCLVAAFICCLLFYEWRDQRKR